MSIELDLMLAPARTYARVAGAWPVSTSAALRRPALVALVIGGALSMSATGSADVRTVVSTTLSWAFVPAAQTLLAMALIASAAPAQGSRAAALDLFFAGHGPWSLWLLAWAAFIALADSSGVVNILLFLPTALIPLVWTAVIVNAYCRHVLQLGRRAALLRTAAHQATTWLLALITYGWAVQLWPRILGYLGW